MWVVFLLPQVLLLWLVIAHLQVNENIHRDQSEIGTLGLYDTHQISTIPIYWGEKIDLNSCHIIIYALNLVTREPRMFVVVFYS